MKYLKQSLNSCIQVLIFKYNFNTVTLQQSSQLNAVSRISETWPSPVTTISSTFALFRT